MWGHAKRNASLGVTTSGRIQLLSKGPCGDAATKDLTAMLHDDTHVSDVQDFARENGITKAPLCRAHANHYTVRRQKDRCTFEDCPAVWTRVTFGVHRCERHNLERSLPEEEATIQPLTVPVRAAVAPGRVSEDVTESGLYEVWMPAGKLGSAQVKYYRFLGEDQGLGEEDHRQIHIPELGLTYPVGVTAL